MAGAPATGRTPPEILYALASAGVLAALTVAGRAGRDSFFLTHFPASDLPRVVMGAAVVSILGALAMSRLLVRAAPVRIVPAAFAVSAALFATEWAFALAAPRVAAVAVYVHVSAVAPLVASSFWAVVNERFDPYTAKRAIARMAAAGALAGVAGGVAAERLVAAFGLPVVLPLLASLSLLCGAGVARIGGPERGPGSTPDGAAGSGLSALREAPLLRQMATLMLLVAVVETLVDYAFKVEASAAFEQGSLMRFFTVFYTLSGLLSFAFQSAFGTRVLQRFGLGGAIALLPAGVALFGSIAVGAGRLWAFVLVRGAESVGWNSFFRSGFELLYTPVPRSVKRPAKAWVDVAARSSGEMAGATFLLALLALLPGLPSAGIVSFGVVASVAALFVVARIHRSYVSQLTDSLNTGRVDMRVDQALDATTAHVLTESRASLDRSDLLARVRAHHAASSIDEAESALAGDLSAETGPTTDPAFERVADLCSGDALRIRRALHARGEAGGSGLRSSAVERRLIAHVIPLLVRSDVGEEVRRFLRRTVPYATGQLVDALLDDDERIEVRIAVARLLAAASERRALAGLFAGLDAPRFDLRAACARSSLRIVGRRPELAPDRDAVHARVERELGVPDAVWESQGVRAADPDPAGPSVLLDGRALGGVSRSLEHVFTLLGMCHGREAVASTLAALHSGSAQLSGTALEYLETVLPPGTRAALWQRLHVGERRTAPERPAEEIAEELMRTTAGLVIDRAALRSARLGSSGD